MRRPKNVITMKTIKVLDGETIKDIEYDTFISSGIFMVSETYIAKNNCKLLNITIGNNATEIHKITKLHKAGILTVQLLNEQIQYIFTDSANKIEVSNFINEFEDENLRRALKAAFDCSKI